MSTQSIYQSPFQQIYNAVFPAPITEWQKFIYFSGYDEARVQKVIAEQWKNIKVPTRAEEGSFAANWSEVNAYLDLKTYEECLHHHREVRAQKMQELPWAEWIAYRIACYFLSYFLKKSEAQTFPSLESKARIWNDTMITFVTNSLNEPRQQVQLGLELSTDPDSQLANGISIFLTKGETIYGLFHLTRVWENKEGLELKESDLQWGLQDKVTQKFTATKCKVRFQISPDHYISDRSFAILIKAMVEKMRASKWDSLLIKYKDTPPEYLSILEQLGFGQDQEKQEYRLEREKLSLTQIAWVNEDFSRDPKIWETIAEPKESVYPSKLHVDPASFITLSC